MTATNFPLDLPPDARGLPSGRLYEAFLRAGYGHAISTGYNTPEIPRLGRSINCLSSIENGLALSLCLNPVCVDYREQYPMCEMEKIRGLLKAGAPIRRNLIPTLDGVGTFSRGGDGFSYVGFSVKHSCALTDEAVVRRLMREKLFCELLGWGWQLFTEREVNPTTSFNATTILSWANTDVVQLDEAERCANVLSKASTNANLLTLLGDAAKRASIAPDRISAVFAHAVLEGLLRVDHTAKVALRKPLVLLA